MRRVSVGAGGQTERCNQIANLGSSPATGKAAEVASRIPQSRDGHARGRRFQWSIAAVMRSAIVAAFGSVALAARSGPANLALSLITSWDRRGDRWDRQRASVPTALCRSVEGKSPATEHFCSIALAPNACPGPEPVRDQTTAVSVPRLPLANGPTLSPKNNLLDTVSDRTF